MSTKRCVKCRRELPVAKFRASATNPDGLTKRCDECLKRHSESRRVRHAADPEKERARCQQWRDRNRDYAREYRREFYFANRDRLLAEEAAKRAEARVGPPKPRPLTGRKYVAVPEGMRRCADCTRLLEMDRFRAINNPERLTSSCDVCRARRRKYAKEHIEQRKISAAAWRESDRGRLFAQRRKQMHGSELKRKYREKHPEKWKAERARYQKGARQRLTDAFVRGELVEGTSLRARDIPPELVALYREHIKVKRLLRRMRDEEHS
ncbi:hypothetical protein ISG27_12595 [Burkholderia pseudomallei]|nr:hypothetical protein [Burkholderia pseudomallei]MBF3975008.1 hypothetical protein [Burkholderia pseudomallei]